MWQPSIFIFLILLIVSINQLPLARARGQWCVVSPSATDAQMQANIDWLCGHGHVDCIPIKPGGPCFEPDNLRSHNYVAAINTHLSHSIDRFDQPPSSRTCKRSVVCGISIGDSCTNAS
ncbi:hypothetical protein YC2023_073290 [Brassica napus]